MKQFIYSLLCVIATIVSFFVIFWLITIISPIALVILCFLIVVVWLFCIYYFNVFNE